MFDELTPVAEARSNRARPGDSDYGQPSGPKPKATTGRKTKHAAKGPGGGQFISGGSTGADVKAVERGLGLQVTGTYSSGVAASVRSYQRKHGLLVDGIVGRQTALALAGMPHRARKVGPGALDAHSRKLLRDRHQGSGRARGSSSRAKSGTSARGGFLVEMEMLVEADVAITWDEALHPRDLRGRFRDKLGGLTPRGQRGPTGLRLPDGTRISKDADGTYRVVRSGRIHSGFRTRDAAVQDALDRSARGNTPESVGGAHRYADFNDFLAVDGAFNAERPAWVDRESLADLTDRLQRAVDENVAAGRDTSTYGSRRRASTEAAVRHLQHRVRQAQQPSGGSSHLPPPGTGGPTVGRPPNAPAVGAVGGLTAEEIAALTNGEIAARRERLRVALLPGGRGESWSAASRSLAERNIAALQAEAARRDAVAAPETARIAASQAARAARTVDPGLTSTIRTVGRGRSRSGIEWHVPPEGVTIRGHRVLSIERHADGTMRVHYRTPRQTRTARIDSLSRLGGPRFTLAAADVGPDELAPGFPQEFTAQAPVLGSDVTMHLQAVGEPGGIPAAYVTRDAIGYARTRTGTTAHSRELRFERVAADAPGGFGARAFTARHPRVVVNGETYMLRTQEVAQNRQARMLGIRTGFAGGRASARDFAADPIRPPGEVVANPPSVSTPSANVAVPAAVTAQRAALPGAETTMLGGSTETRVVLQRVLADLPGFQAATNTELEAVDRVGVRGVDYLYLRGRDGRSWSINTSRVHGMGDFSSTTVQVRTQAGQAHSAPAMARYLHGITGGTPPRELSSVEVSASSAHPAAVAGSPARHGASRSGPSPAIAPAAAQTAPGTAPQVLGTPVPAPGIAGPKPTVRVAGGNDRERAQGAKVQAIVDRLHGFSREGFTCRITNASMDDFSGIVLNVDGRQVGSFSRDVNFNSDGTPDHVYHSIFQIRGTDRASGFGTKLVEEMFDSYREQGFGKVKVSAGLSSGGYQWAKMGFELATAERGGEEGRGRAIRDFLSGYSGKMSRAVSEGLVPQALIDELQRQVDEGMITSMSQLAAWGRRTTWRATSEGKEHTIWLGKYILLGSGWSGVKKL